MSNDQNWQPPVEPPQTPAAPFGSPTPPIEPGATLPPPPTQPFGAPPGAGASGGAHPGAPQGWTPPPKPGLIPLRPLQFSEVLGAAFRALRRNPKPTYGAALIVYGITVIATAVIAGLVTWSSLQRITSADPNDVDTIMAGTMLGFVAATIVPMILSVIGTAVLQGVLVVEVASASLGDKLTLRKLLARVRGRIWALIGWAFLLVIVGTIALVGLVFLAVIVGVVLGGFGGAILGTLIGVLGGLGLLVLSVWLGTKVSLVPSVMVLERASLRQSITRSWSLTNDHFWRTFGVQVLILLIINIAIQIISTPLSLVAGLSLGLVDPNGSNAGTALTVGIILTVISYVITIAIGALGAVVQSAAPALIYLDLRIRKEGLDLELIRYIEQRQAGVTDQPDPFRIHPAEAPVQSWSTLQPDNESPWA